MDRLKQYAALVCMFALINMLLTAPAVADVNIDIRSAGAISNDDHIEYVVFVED
jgi:hypothetical protein